MKISERELTTVGILGGISTALMFFEFPLPFMPPFLRLDLSTIPVLIAGFLFGPVQGIIVALIKDFIHLLSTQTGGIGELADFICAFAMVIPSSLIYIKKKNKKGAFIGLFASVVLLIVASALTNMFLMLPMYMGSAGFDVKLNIVLTGIIPFNLIKGVVLSLITLLLYKKISTIIKQY